LFCCVHTTARAKSDWLVGWRNSVLDTGEQPSRINRLLLLSHCVQYSLLLFSFFFFIFYFIIVFFAFNTCVRICMHAGTRVRVFVCICVYVRVFDCKLPLTHYTRSIILRPVLMIYFFHSLSIFFKYSYFFSSKLQN
jgi:hypothetical protein